MFNEIGKVLIFFGLALVAVGLVLTLIPSLRLGRLPGDILIRRDNWSVYIPIASSVLLSVVLSLLLWIVASLRR
ncbi:MAG: DUF2905 domain-containing protein [Acidobacteriota bacterium]